MRTLTKRELTALLDSHAKWVLGEDSGSRADLSGANLSGANLSRANLYGADLSGANLSGANLSRANLYGANLYGANLSRANLSGANLSRANLYGANLYGANLYGANLYGANLYGANLSDAKNVPAPWIVRTQIVPQVGAFTAFKKLRDGIVAELEIPGTAKRLGGSLGRKCRASEALVIAFYKDRETRADVREGSSMHNPSFAYRVGEVVRPDAFDADALNECSSGIHFFLSFDEAAEFSL